MSNILVIPDSHCKPGQNFRRFEWLGNLIAERRPDAVVQIGDFFDMESLSSYDKGKASFEGRNFKADIDAGLEADALMWAPLRKRKKALPTRYFTEGNHEERYWRLLSYEPQLKGELRQPTLPGWNYKPFLQPLKLEGVIFIHYFVSGLMGRAISGEHPAASIIKQHMVSGVCGHSHIADYAERTRSDGQKVQGLVAGCFLDEVQSEDYARATEHLWSNGVWYLHDVKNGAYDPERIGYNRLKKEYS